MSISPITVKKSFFTRPYVIEYMSAAVRSMTLNRRASKTWKVQEHKMSDTPLAARQNIHTRVEYVDTMRGVCILLVNYFHANFTLFMYKYVADICVHPFLFMAGYFYSRRLSFRDNAIKKARSNLFPYYVFGLFYYFVWLCFSGNPNGDVIAPLRAVLYLPTGFFPIESALYFLPMMFFGVIIFSLIGKNIGSEKLRLLAVLLITLLGNIWIKLSDARLPMSIDVAMSLLIYIYLGYNGRKILSFTDSMLARLKSRWSKVLVFIILAVMNYIAIELCPISNIRNGEWGIIPMTHLNTCVTMLLWVYFFRWFDKVHAFSALSRVLKYIGRNSMIFMCFSHVGLKISQVIVSRLPLPLPVYNIAYYFLSIVVILPVVFIFNRTKLHLIFGR